MRITDRFARALCVVVLVSVQTGRGHAQDHAGEQAKAPGPSSDEGQEQAQADRHTRDVPGPDVARAEGYASDAFDAYSRQDYLKAVGLYRLALAASASPDIVYNLARIYDAKLKDRALAIEFYQRYTGDPGADPERARVATARLAALRELERTKLAGTSESRTAESASPAGAAAHSASTARSAAGLSSLQLASIFVGAVGLAGVGVGIGFGVDAKSNADVSHELCNGNLCTSPRGLNAARDASNSAMVSTVGFIAGGALVAAGVTMLIVGSTGSTERQASARLVPYADRYGAGTRLIGRW